MILLKIIFGLLGLSLVVVIHEAGHFVAARMSGIKVEAFSIGWGKILYRRMWGDTEFRLSLIPLGGYCKMQGEQALIQAWETHAREVESSEGDMYAASWWKRILVSLSGPLMNLISAVLIFFFIGLIGYNIYYYPSRIVLASEYTERADYPANLSGLKTGDIVRSVNSKGIYRFDQLQKEVSLNPEETLMLIIEREGAERSLEIVPELNLQSGSGYVGIYPWIEPVVRKLSETSLFNSQGVLPGDRFQQINGIDIYHAVQLSSIIDRNPLESFAVIREGQRKEFVLPEAVKISDPGIQYDFIESRTQSGNFFLSLKDGFSETAHTLISSIKGIALLFRGIDLQSAVSGPLRITYLTGDLAFSGFRNSMGEGFLTFFRFIALINVALCVMNLLPIPVLDGGQIILFLIEGIFRRKPNPQAIYRYQLLGTFLVFGLIIFATMNDILFFSRK